MRTEDEIIEHCLYYLEEKDSKKAKSEDCLDVLEDYLEDPDIDLKYIYHELLVIHLLENYKTNRLSLMESIFKKVSPKLYHVYKLMKNGKEVYIGQSINVSARLKKHLDKDFDEILICQCRNKDEMDNLENYLILKILPKLNNKVFLDKARCFEESPFSFEFKKLEDLDYDFIPCMWNVSKSVDSDKYLYRYPYFVKNKYDITPAWKLRCKDKEEN